MNYSVIVLSSVTSAKRVEKMAEKYGISCVTGHTPSVIAKYGCSHCVKVNPKHTNNLVQLCNELGLDVKGVYTEKKVGDKMVYEKVGRFC